jgi:hypothetical protein
MTHTTVFEYLQIDAEGRILSRQQSTDVSDGTAADAWKAHTLDILQRPIGRRTHLSAGPVDDDLWEIELREDWEFHPIDPAGDPFLFTTITRHEFKEATDVTR